MKKLLLTVVMICIMVSTCSFPAFACSNCDKSYAYSANGQIAAILPTWGGTTMYECCSKIGYTKTIAAGDPVVIYRGTNYYDPTLKDENGNVVGGYVGWYYISHKGDYGWVDASHVQVNNDEFRLMNHVR